MDRNEARAHVAKLASEAAFAPYAERARQLLDDPGTVQQSSFGVCGMAAVVRSLLIADDLAQFAELLDAIFLDKPFNGIPVPAGTLLAGRIKQWTRKNVHEATLGLDPPHALYALDFILARALGKLLKVRSPRIYEVQLMTSADISATFQSRPDDSPVQLFDLPAKYGTELDAGSVGADLAYLLRMKDWRAAYLCGFSIDPAGATVEILDRGKKWHIVLVEADRRLLVTAGADRLVVSYDAYAEAFQGEPLVYQAAVNESVIYQKDGDLALDPTGLETIMTGVIGSPACTYTALTGDVDAAVKTINNQFGLPRPYVYGFVNGTAGWLSAMAGNADPFAGPAAPARQLYGRSAPVGAHILVITGAITKDATHYHVPTWTWANSFVARIPIAFLPGYLPGCSHGRL